MTELAISQDSPAAGKSGLTVACPYRLGVRRQGHDPKTRVPRGEVDKMLCLVSSPEKSSVALRSLGFVLEPRHLRASQLSIFATHTRMHAHTHTPVD